MYDLLCYRLIRGFGYVVRNRLQKPAHRFFVIRWKSAIPLHHHFFFLAQLTNLMRRSDACHDVENIKANFMQRFQITGIRPALVSFVAPLRVPSYATYLGHFLLF